MEKRVSPLRRSHSSGRNDNDLVDDEGAKWSMTMAVGGQWLDFEEDVFAVEEPVGDKADSYEGDGEGERGDFCAAIEGEEVVIGPVPGRYRIAIGADGVGDFYPDHVDDEEFGDAEGGDCVGAEDEPGEGEPLPCFGFVEVAYIDEPVEDCEGQESAACAEEDVGAGPEIFVDGEPDVPEGSCGETEDSGEEEAGEALRLGQGLR